MPVAGMMTPVSKTGFKNLQLDAGMFLVDFDWTEYTDADALREAAFALIGNDEKCLGMTRGGGSFVIGTEERQVEADGIRYRFIGDTRRDSVDPYISTTLLEITKGNIKRMLGSADVTTTGNKTSIKLRTRIDENDYIRNLCWVGDQADFGLILIGFKYAWNTAGINITFTDKGEATAPVEMHSFQGDVEDYEYAPFEIVILKPATTGGNGGTTGGD